MINKSANPPALLEFLQSKLSASCSRALDAASALCLQLWALTVHICGRVLQWCGGGRRGGRGHMLEGCRYHGKICPCSTWQHRATFNSLTPYCCTPACALNTFSCFGYSAAPLASHLHIHVTILCCISYFQSYSHSVRVLV